MPSGHENTDSTWHTKICPDEFQELKFSSIRYCLNPCLKFRRLTESHANVSERFPDISEDCRRIPMNRKIRRCFDCTQTNLKFTLLLKRVKHVEILVKHCSLYIIYTIKIFYPLVPCTFARTSQFSCSSVWCCLFAVFDVVIYIHNRASFLFRLLFCSVKWFPWKSNHGLIRFTLEYVLKKRPPGLIHQ